MRGNRVLASLTTIALLASCAPPPTRALRKPEGHPTGIAVVPSIPVESLMTHRPSDIDDDDPCGSVPPELVESEGFPDPPVLDAIGRLHVGLRRGLGPDHFHVGHRHNGGGSRLPCAHGNRDRRGEDI